MQTAQTNLFPAFEGPDHQNLHTKGKGCVCNPYFKVEMLDEVEITHFRHQPLTEANKADPPAWLCKCGAPRRSYAANCAYCERLYL